MHANDWMAMICAMLLGILIALSATRTHAHDWYPSECCNGKDCYEIDPSLLEVTPQGYRIIPSGEIIPFNRLRASPNSSFHRCSRGGALANPTLGSHKPQSCFWVPGTV